MVIYKPRVTFQISIQMVTVYFGYNLPACSFTTTVHTSHTMREKSRLLYARYAPITLLSISPRSKITISYSQPTVSTGWWTSSITCCSQAHFIFCCLFCHIGDMQNEGSVLEWLTDDENRELEGEIEQVNIRMLKRLLDESPFIAAYFCK